MTNQPQPYDPGRMRISDKDRNAVAEVLREAAGEGRIDLTELDQRLEAAYAAKTYADLVPITADLPVRQHPGPAVQPVPRAHVPSVPAPRYDGSFAFMAETSRRELWEVGKDHWAFAMMGSVVLDLRHARFTSQHVTITANAIMGSVQIIVNPLTHAVVDGIGIMGDYSLRRSKVQPQIGPESPVIRVKGIALMASVEVVRKG